MAEAVGEWGMAKARGAFTLPHTTSFSTGRTATFDKNPSGAGNNQLTSFAVNVGARRAVWMRARPGQEPPLVIAEGDDALDMVEPAAQRSKPTMTT